MAAALNMHYYAYMKTAADLFKLLAEPSRARLLHALTQGEFCVCELTDAIQMPQYAVSRSLAALRKSGWVAERREGTWMYYRLAPAHTSLINGVVRLMVKHGLDAKTFTADTKRLQKRLVLREGGRCVLGYGQV